MTKLSFNLPVFEMLCSLRVVIIGCGRLYFLLLMLMMCLTLTFAGFDSQGEAKSAQLIGQAIANNPAFITLRRIEAAREIAHTISNAANKVMLSADDLLLNLDDMTPEPATTGKR